METNPLDRATIVSVYHKAVHVVKETIQPGRFVIPAAPDDEKFSLTVIEPSSWWKNSSIEGEQPMEVVCPATQVANAIVEDYVSALHCAMRKDRRPGLFVCLGEHTPKSILLYKDKEGNSFDILLTKARRAQIEFYRELVRVADIQWSKGNRNPLTVSDDARLAANKLGLKETKEWMQDFKASELVNCKSCGYLVMPNYPLCANCKNPIAGMK
jgi:hypothetical protein